MIFIADINYKLIYQFSHSSEIYIKNPYLSIEMRCLEYAFNLSILLCRWEQTHNHKFKFFCLLLNKIVWTAFLTILQAEQKVSFCKMYSNKYLNLNLFNTLKLKTFYAIWHNVKGTRKIISFEILINVLSICSHITSFHVEFTLTRQIW